MMENSAPRISVITVVYNRVASMEDTILSVINQEYANVEYIVIDGGSTDGTLEIINKYSDRISKYVSEPDNGIYDAMNKGIALASGDWINFMNCGDRFASNTAFSFFQKGALDADIVYGDAIIQYPGFESPWPILNLKDMWKRAAFCHQACFTRTEVMKEFKFDLSYSVSADFDFLYRAWRLNLRFRYVHELICYYDFREGASITNQFRSLRERKAAVLKHDFSFAKWIYFTFTQTYLRTAAILKEIIGPRLTRWITRSLRK